MNILQAAQKFSKFQSDDTPGVLDYVTQAVVRAFYVELDKHLQETPGGVILGVPKVSVSTNTDIIFGGEFTTVRMTATCEDLPLPPEYRFIGGPADGYNLRTRGERVWRVPVAPPITGAYSYASIDAPAKLLVAEYERQGDTGAYFYQRTVEA